MNGQARQNLVPPDEINELLVRDLRIPDQTLQQARFNRAISVDRHRKRCRLPLSYQDMMASFDPIQHPAGSSEGPDHFPAGEPGELGHGHATRTSRMTT